MIFGFPEDNAKYAYAVVHECRHLGHSFNIEYMDCKGIMKCINSIVIMFEQRRLKAEKKGFTLAAKLAFMKKWKEMHYDLMIDMLGIKRTSLWDCFLHHPVVKPPVISGRVPREPYSTVEYMTFFSQNNQAAIFVQQRMSCFHFHALLPWHLRPWTLGGWIQQQSMCRQESRDNLHLYLPSQQQLLHKSWLIIEPLSWITSTNYKLEFIPNCSTINGKIGRQSLSKWEAIQNCSIIIGKSLQNIVLPSF